MNAYKALTDGFDILRPYNDDSTLTSAQKKSMHRTIRDFRGAKWTLMSNLLTHIPKQTMSRVSTL